MAYDSPEAQALFKVEFEGAAGIAYALKQMEPKVVRRIVRRSLKAAGAPMLVAARALVPVSEEGSHGHLPGHLWRHIELFTARAPGKGSYSVGIGIRGQKGDNPYAWSGKDHPYYAPFVEFGHYAGKRKVWTGKWSVSYARRKVHSRWRQGWRTLTTTELVQRGGRGQRKVMDQRMDRAYVDPQRFLRPAFEQTKDEAMQILEAELTNEIETVWEREGRDFVGAFGPGGMSQRRAAG